MIQFMKNCLRILKKGEISKVKERFQIQGLIHKAYLFSVLKHVRF